MTVVPARRRGHTTSQITQEGFVKGWIKGASVSGNPRADASLGTASAPRQMVTHLCLQGGAALRPGTCHYLEGAFAGWRLSS